MKALRLLYLFGALATGESTHGADFSAGSQLPQAENKCATCHGEEFLWEGKQLRFFVHLDSLSDDVHWKNGVNCHDCHGGNPSTLDFQEAHSPGAGDADSHAVPFQPLLSQQDRSSARLELLIQVCGKCHAQSASSYLDSVHGEGLQKSGLIVSAVCTDCHGSHGMFVPTDPRSTLNESKVGTTCAQCHRFIEERLQKSIHGLADAPPTEGPEGAQSIQRKPCCIDCHRGHNLPHPNSSTSRLAQPDQCGSCHEELESSYARSLHGKLTELGYLPAAKCSDCHGSHDILSVEDAASHVSSVNRKETCAQCHPNATDGFVQFDPHSNPDDLQSNAVLYWVNQGLTGLLMGVFIFFGAHSILWLVRSLPWVIQHGRAKYPTPGQRAYLRFRPVHRVAHAVLVTSFLGLALTGLPLKYSHLAWAQTISWALGGFVSTGLWHRLFGITNFCCLIFYVCWFSYQLLIGPKTDISRFQQVFGPDSPVPNRRDFTDFAAMVRWFLGFGPKPTFERWSYWEKFDLWAASADIILIGTTGLILWFPNQFCNFLPGQAINIADLIHGKLALLATGFVFAIHFFNSNLRPEKFPMDLSILIGLVSEEEMQEERPELLERLRATNRLDQYVAVTPPASRLRLAMLAGFIGIGIGLALLLGILVAVF